MLDLQGLGKLLNVITGGGSEVFVFDGTVNVGTIIQSWPAVLLIVSLRKNVIVFFSELWSANIHFSFPLTLDNKGNYFKSRTHISLS